MTTSRAALRQKARATLGLLRHWIRRFPALRRVVMLLLRPVLTPLVDRLVHRYGDWVHTQATLSVADRAAIARHVAALGSSPLISVVMPVYNTPEPLLRAAIASVEAQLWPHWQLCIADDASPAPHVSAVLAEAAARDPRIRTMRRGANGHICAASNSALALATGDWVALMDHDDLLPDTALYEIAAAVASRPDLAVLYSDEDNIDGTGRRTGPYFKPDFDPELLLAQNLVSHLGAYRRDLMETIGGFREGFEGSQDHELVLRATRHCGAARVGHIPAVLYHWRQFSSVASFSESAIERCIETSARAVAEHLAALGVQGARVERAPLVPMFNRVVFPLPATPPLASIIIPARAGAAHIAVMIKAIQGGAQDVPMEILVVTPDGATPPGLAPAAKARLRVLASSGAYSRARLCNHGAAAASGSVLVLLADDLMPQTPGWLATLVAQAIRPEIGAVGAKLLTAADTIAHAGYVLGLGGPDRLHGSFGEGLHATDPGPSGRLVVTRCVSAVSASAMALRRDVFTQAGGFDAEAFDQALHDVDLCLRLRAMGLRNICAPDATLRHLGPAPRMAGDEDERARLRTRWSDALLADPFWNPNLSLARADGELALPSRRTPPWRGV